MSTTRTTRTAPHRPRARTPHAGPRSRPAAGARRVVDTRTGRSGTATGPPRRTTPAPAARTRARGPRRRLLAVLVLLGLLFAVVVGRLAQLQFVGDRYVALGDAQAVRPVELAAARGSIFDRNGYDLALSVPQHTVWADPALVTDPMAEAAALTPVLRLDAALLQSRLSQAGRFVYLARQVPDDVAAQVESLALDGVYLLDEPKRFNPAGSLARSVLGSVNLDNVGASGLELQHDDLLTGEPGELVIERDPNGRTIPTGEHQVSPASPGDDLVLTIDRALRFEAERLLAQQIAAMGARGGTIIATRPATGEILAMANVAIPAPGQPPVPTADNRALTQVFEPGSVNKVITLAAALEEGVATLDSVLTVPDHLRVSDHTFTDHDPHPTSQWTLSDIMTTSSNIGTIMLAQQLGPEGMDRYLRSFGFGAPSGLGFPDESSGLLLEPDDWWGTSIGSIPIGQGIAVTALQMLSAYNVIANGGMYVEPKLVLATVDEDGESHPTPASERRRVVSEPVANQVRDMMVNVVAQGTGRQAAIEGYHVAGKTGTARKPQPTGGYRDAAGNFHYVATFAGFVPAEDPQLSIIVILDEPSATIFASAVSAPVFADLARYGLRLFTIPPPAQELRPTVPAPTAETAEDSANEVPGGRRAAVTTTTTTTVAASP
jgi:cell division protein FtsI (penicillin-binding protein 3)